MLLDILGHVNPGWGGNEEPGVDTGRSINEWRFGYLQKFVSSV